MSKKFDVIVIGAVAAGLMCAIEAEKRNKKVLTVEHTSKITKKIRISGGGKCNLQIYIAIMKIFYRITIIFVNLLFQNIRKMIL